jgi:hypothetical protein
LTTHCFPGSWGAFLPDPDSAHAAPGADRHGRDRRDRPGTGVGGGIGDGRFKRHHVTKRHPKELLPAALPRYRAGGKGGDAGPASACRLERTQAWSRRTHHLAARKEVRNRKAKTPVTANFARASTSTPSIISRRPAPGQRSGVGLARAYCAEPGSSLRSPAYLTIVSSGSPAHSWMLSTLDRTRNSSILLAGYQRGGSMVPRTRTLRASRLIRRS